MSLEQNRLRTLVDANDLEGIRRWVDEIVAGAHADKRIDTLLLEARAIWGPDFKQPIDEIVVRLMVGVGDLARAARDGCPEEVVSYVETGAQRWRAGVQKELGNLIFSVIRWCDDLGFDPLDCVAAAKSAQRDFAKSGRKR